MNGAASLDALWCVRQRLLEAACGYDFRRRAWRCPSCRRPGVLTARELPDGSLSLRCEALTRVLPHGLFPSRARVYRAGCVRGSILAALGLTFLDVGPAAFRHGERVA